MGGFRRPKLGGNAPISPPLTVNHYEEQGILEDVDTNHRDSADGTDHYAGSHQLYVV